MNRLESIKERLNEGVKTESGLREIHDHAPEDIEYLLSKLDHYETALKKIDTTETHLQAKFFAMEALKEDSNE